MLKNLTREEMISIDAGHDGAAYNAGASVGKAIGKLAVIAGLAAWFFN